jgi:hypothetical protein
MSDKNGFAMNAKWRVAPTCQILSNKEGRIDFISGRHQEFSLTR